MARTGLAARCSPLVFGLAALCALAPGASAQEKVGVNAAVDPSAEGTPPNGPTRRLELGQDIVHNEHVATGPVGQTQVVFLDQSALTVGPNSDMTIDNFVYNPDASTGQLAMSATRGVMRFVGGKISKLDNAVTMNTPAASLGIRGGIFLLNLSPNGQLYVVFLYGKSLTVTANGQTQTIIHPGWSVFVNGRGATPSAPRPASDDDIANILALLSGRPGTNGGAKFVPSDSGFINSGIPTVVSGDVIESTLQADRKTPPWSPPPIVNVSTLQGDFQINTVAMQPVVVGASGAVTRVSSGTTTAPPLPTGPSTPLTPFQPPTVNFPTFGAGSYTGTATGTVVNNGTTYQATGNFSQTYNFGSATGVIGISNFDNANYTYSVTGSGSNFSGNLTSGPASRTGNVSGSFSGPGAIDTSGNFGIQSTGRIPYSVTGTFSGH